METKRICPECRRPLADDAPQGLCPTCLVKAGLGSGVSIDPETKSGQPHFIAPSLEELSGRFPQLEIISFIGQGGMGAVYKARQKQLDRVVALKILPPGIGQAPSFAERFSREAKALAKLDHPGIVTIHDFGQADGLFFFVMEFVDGLNLRQLLQSGRVSPHEALAIVPQICDALQYAHDVGIVHRDIKPENILLDRRGRVKVADFGLAKLVGVGNELISDSGTAAGSAALTEAGKIIGTPNYIAPEQMEHPGEVDHRADIYALGVVLYQMLTGELPGKPIRPPSDKVHIDVRLDEIVLRALEQTPERRYQQVSVFKTDVETIARIPGAASNENQKAINEAEWRNPANWSFGLYFSKRDSRSLWVPRRLRGFGWTINLGHWQGAAFLLGSIVLLVLLLVLGIPSKHNNTQAVFGPITERTLSIRGNECAFLSFRTGEVLRHSYFDGDQRDSTPPTAFRQWVREHGVDIGFCASTETFYGPLGLLALEMGTYPFPYDAVPQHMIPRFRSVAEWQTYDAQHKVPANKPLIGSLAGVTNIWNDLTADQVDGPTNEAPAFFLKEKQPSLWFRSTNLTTHPIAFSTRDGVQGLLQITGFTENPPVLKLRYKLVSHAGSASP